MLKNMKKKEKPVDKKELNEKISGKQKIGVRRENFSLNDDVNTSDNKGK